MRESIQATVARFIVRSVLKPALQPAVPVLVQRRWAGIATRTLSVPFSVRFARSSLAAVPTEVVRAKSAAAGSGAVLFLHGGAYMIGSPVSHRSITARLATLTRATVFVPDYRLAPEHPFPAALDDALACYRALLAQGYSPAQIAVAGDSAGGGLALSLCLRLRSESLPQPYCLALISPWADLTLTQLAPVTNDALLHPTWLKQGAAAYLHEHSAQDPFASALYADLAGLPPTLLQAASLEILRNDARRLAGALTAAGVAVEHREFPDMWHDFQLYAGIVPEATQAVNDIARFIGSRLLAAPPARQATIRTTSEPRGQANGTHLA
ncbi:MAG TPA: alpha/beta hydrolase [Steroidobacteraceae bacterium]|nr:alpha/beta hydrolase [Steroidobacteraceae bacterium]